MLTITEIKSYISEAITQYQSVYVDADIVPVTVCPASRRRAVRNRVINECGLDYKEDAYGTDAEVIFGPNGKQILIYQSMMKTKQQVFQVISQILCKHRFRCKTEQNIFKAGAAEAVSALSTK